MALHIDSKLNLKLVTAGKSGTQKLIENQALAENYSLTTSELKDPFDRYL